MTADVIHGRYLTDEAKREILAGWHARRDERPPGDHFETIDAPEGWPDPEIFPLCDALNALSGVCTLQSCAGHRRRSAIDGEEYIESGGLWLALSEDVWRRAYASIPNLLALPSIEEASIRFGRWDQDVFEIVFSGLERGSLDAATVDILSFFQSVMEFGP